MNNTKKYLLDRSSKLRIASGNPQLSKDARKEMDSELEIIQEALKEQRESPQTEPVAKHLDNLILSDNEINDIALDKFPIKMREPIFGPARDFSEHNRKAFILGFKGAVGMIESYKESLEKPTIT